MKIHRRSFLITLGVGVAVFGVLLGIAQAQLERIEYPVPELSNCKDETACRTYCETPANLSACLNFAEKHGLMSDEELKTARKFEQAGGEGPGGCTSKDSCDKYCNNISRIDECLAFAKEHDILPKEELEEAERVKAAIDGGATLPGGCTSKAACEEYCTDPNHMEECITFAERAGFIPQDELAEAKKVLVAIKEKGVRPPACRGRKACESYCNEAGHIDECLAFGEAAGFVTPEEAKMARSFMAAGGPQALGCSGQDCRQVCEQSPEKCAAFFTDHADLLPEEARAQMRGGAEQMKTAFAGAPPEVLECIKGKIGADFVDKVTSGGEVPVADMMRLGPRMGDDMKACFEAGFGGGFGPPGEGGEHGFPGGADLIADCMKAAGFEWPPQGAPSPEMQAQIPKCAQEAGAGQGGPPEGFPGQGHEGFPGGAPGGFPGGPGGFPQGGPGFPGGEGIPEQFRDHPPTQEDIDRIRSQYEGQYQPGGPGGDHPEGAFPIPTGQLPSGEDHPPSAGDQYQQEFQRQYEQQYQQQYQQQYEQQQQEQYQQQYQEQQQQNYGEHPPDQPPPPPPQSYRRPSLLHLLGTVILNFFGVPVR